MENARKLLCQLNILLIRKSKQPKQKTYFDKLNQPIATDSKRKHFQICFTKYEVLRHCEFFYCINERRTFVQVEIYYGCIFVGNIYFMARRRVIEGL